MPGPTNTNSLLIERAAEGDQQAFKELYTTHVQELVGYVAARLGSLEEARDLIHDLFVSIWENRQQLTSIQSFRAFLFAAARYRIIDHIRRNHTRRDYAERISAMGLPVTQIEEYLDARSLEQKIDQALEALPPRTREIFRLSRYEHRNVREIATNLHISERTVKNQLTVALAFLRSWLDATTLLLFYLFF